MDTHRQREELGPCCCCGSMYKVRNLVMLDERAPEPGTGWGCVICGLPADGALAVVCDLCLQPLETIRGRLKFACRGYPTKGERVPIGELTGPFEHDPNKHPEAPRPIPAPPAEPVAALRSAPGDGAQLVEPHRRNCLHCGKPVDGDALCPDCNRYVCLACAWDYGHHSGGKHGR